MKSAVWGGNNPQCLLPGAYIPLTRPDKLTVPLERLRAVSLTRADDILLFAT